MRKSGLLGIAALACVASVVGQWSVSAGRGSGGDESEGGVAGSSPDVIVGSLPSIKKWGTVAGVTGYSVATTSCNIGNSILKWCDTNNNSLPCTKNEHPVISQNIYRLKDGRFEQIGMSWVKHGFCALSENLCGPCTSDPFGCDALGIGCSDPYSVDNNGLQTSLGPQSQINPVTGIFPYPFTAPSFSGLIARRLQIKNTDLDPAMNAGSLYFAQGDYVQLEDAAAGNDLNNASYRRLTVGTFAGGGYNLTATGTTLQQKTAMEAWKQNGLGVGVPDPNVVISSIDVPGDGRFVLGYKASEIGDGWWHYEIAIQNYSSHRAARSLTIPVPACVESAAIGFHDVDHHSGEPFDNTDWETAASPVGAIRWEPLNASDEPITFDVNANANALRWTTMYTFRFDAKSPPVASTATLELFKPGAEGDPQSVEFAILAPAPFVTSSDLDGNGSVDGADLGLLLGAFDTDDCAADLDGTGLVDGADLGLLLGDWD